jgi:hypothetical protein
VVEAGRPAGLLITASFGVSVATGEDIDFVPLYRAADDAMYRAKAEGRYRVPSLAAGVISMMCALVGDGEAQSVAPEFAYTPRAASYVGQR